MCGYKAQKITKCKMMHKEKSKKLNMECLVVHSKKKKSRRCRHLFHRRCLLNPHFDYTTTNHKKTGEKINTNILKMQKGKNRVPGLFFAKNTGKKYAYFVFCLRLHLKQAKIKKKKCNQFFSLNVDFLLYLL